MPPHMAVPMPKSKGEQKLKALLEAEFPGYKIHSQVPIKFKRQTMYVDFMIHGLNLAFEFDGIQHTKHIPFFHATSREFRVSKNRDVIKGQLLSDLGYTLIRINYDEELNPENLRRRITEALSK